MRHRPAREAAHDLLGRLDLLERHGWAGRNELEEVARLQRRSLVDERREPVVEVGAVAADGGPERVRACDGCLQRVDDVGIGRVRLAALPELHVPGVLEPRPAARAASSRSSASRSNRSSRAPPMADGVPGEELRAEGAIEADRLEEPRTAVARDVGDPHLGHHLEHALLEPGEQPALRSSGEGRSPPTLSSAARRATVSRASRGQIASAP